MGLQRVRHDWATFTFKHIKVLHWICQQIWKSQQRPEGWKRPVFIPIPKKGNAKECSNYCTMSHASKIMLKILQVRLQQYVNWELPDIQAGFRKGGGGTRSQIINNHWIMEKARKFFKKSKFALLTKLKSLTVWITTNCGKCLNRWGYFTCLLRNLYAGQEAMVRTRHGTMDWFKIGKGVYQGSHLVILVI